MKILIVNFSDYSGGAARAAYRLHQSLRGIGVDSKMLVMHKETDDPDVLLFERRYNLVISYFRSRFDNYPITRYHNRKRGVHFSNANAPFSGIVDTIDKINPDIVHLHWICYSMMSLKDISRIKQPIVWSLHDMWPFTGGCHTDDYCGRYTQGCGKCPILRSFKMNDFSKKLLSSKINYLKHLNISVVGLSKWMADCANKSSLFKGKNILNIPNPIDENAYRPIEKKEARKILRLDADRQYVMTGSLDLTDQNKGISYLLKAIPLLATKKIKTISCGTQVVDKNSKSNKVINNIGFLKDDISMALYYSSADVFVLPSKLENLSNMIMESLACGTPVVAFDVGGNSDMIVHKENGYLAKPFDEQDLARGIDWVLNHKDVMMLAKNARKTVVEKFEASRVANQYKELYECLI